MAVFYIEFTAEDEEGNKYEGSTNVEYFTLFNNMLDVSYKIAEQYGLKKVIITKSVKL